VPALRRVPGWHRYVVARCVSAAGSALTWIALPVLAFQLTGSGIWTAVVVAFDAVPYLFLGLVAGRTADVRDRKMVIIMSDVLSGMAMLTLLAADSIGTLSPWHLAGVAFVVQACFVFGDAAHLGGLRTLVGPHLVMTANSRLYGYIGILECIGPAIAGLALVSISPVTLLAIDGVTFIACAAIIATLPTALSPADRDGAKTDSIWHGLSYLWNHPLIRDLTMANLVISICNGALFAQLVIWAADEHGVNAGNGWLGVLYAGISVGGIIGSFGVERLAALGHPRAVIGGSCAVAGVSALVGAWIGSFAVACVLFALFSGAVFAAMVIGVSIRQSRSPENMVGMVNTTGRMLALGIGYPVGAFGSAFIADATDSTALGMSVAFVLVLLVWPFLRLNRELDDADIADVPEPAAGLQAPE
jgi:hypothetical protein